MSEYRHRNSGEVKTQGEWRSHFSNVSLPKVWKQATLESLKLDAVFETPRPAVGDYQRAMRNGVEQDSAGNWVQAWKVVDMFADDEEGTKAEKEAAYQAELDASAAAQARRVRDDRLSETDWWAVSDRTTTAAEKAYRKALRDITSHENWPYLNDEDWPTKPE